MPLVSCGVLLVDDRWRVLACHATGTSRWDLPKGMAEPGEAARDAAVREAWEEAGLRLPGALLADLGETAYLRGKRLHLFALRVADGGLDIDACRCRSFFPDRHTGRLVPEADGYAWQPLDEPGGWCGRNMARVLSNVDRARVDAAPRVDRVEVDTVSH
jgi:8-oxo-dGTP pyrophosphatase MutT (NUDIX family)